MQIETSTAADIDTIFSLYDAGTLYQKKVAEKYWQGFKRSLIEHEVRENRQWKITVDGEIACVFAIAFSDPLIWQEKNNDPALYLHRIATNPLFYGNSYVKHIVTWAKEYARHHEKYFIRMDTGSGNEKLNNYYISCGFTYLGITTLGETNDLPDHYKGGSSSLFEIRL